MRQNIDTLKELREEKKRLRQEMNIARHFLDVKVDQTFDKGKRIVTVNASWPLVISSLAAFGAKQFAPSASGANNTDDYSSSEFNLTDGIQQGIAAMQQPGKEKWYAILPLALKFLEQWLTSKPVSNEPAQYRSNEYKPTTHHKVVVPPTAPIAR